MTAHKDAFRQSTRRRKIYSRPKLVCYGRIAALTRAAGGTGGNDGGSGKLKKTGL